MTTIVTKFEIPSEIPIPEEERGLGPSAELVDFIPKPLCLDDFLSRQIEEIITYAGTYGMGGPGFFGLRLGEDWLIVAIWGAGEWLQLSGRRVQDLFYNVNGTPKPWISEDGDELSPLLVGRTIKSAQVSKAAMRIVFDNDLALVIEEDSHLRPFFQGTGQPRAFLPEDDLRNAVFLSPTAEIWV